MNRFRIIFIGIFLLGFGLSGHVQAQYNNWALGFRIGEPSGVNVRKYYGTKRAFDLNVGTYGGLYGTRRHYRQGDYKSVGWSVQGHMIWYTPLTSSESIRAYYGLGGQINSRKYYNPGNPNPSSSISLGPSAVVGLEFFPANKPFSFFLEGGAYVELAPAPLFANVNSGLGVRYNF